MLLAKLPRRLNALLQLKLLKQRRLKSVLLRLLQRLNVLQSMPRRLKLKLPRLLQKLLKLPLKKLPLKLQRLPKLLPKKLLLNSFR